MDHLQKCRVKVIKYIKTGRISKEAGETALGHVKKFAMQGKMADVDIILEKIGALKSGPTKKILSAGDEANNPYLQKRKPRSKMPLIICVVVLVICGVVLLVGLNTSKRDVDDYTRRMNQKQEADRARQSGKTASDLNRVIGEEAPAPKGDGKSEDVKKDDSKKEEPAKKE